jgi:hypothetical protein
MATGSTQPLMVSATATLAAGTTSSNVALAGSGEAVLVYNATGVLAFIRFGMDATVVATSADMPIPPGARMLIHAGEFSKTVAAVLASGSGALYFSRGQGTVY